jgi:hypothetical protein
MARKRFKPEEIGAKLRQVDVLMTQGQNFHTRRYRSQRTIFLLRFLDVWCLLLRRLLLVLESSPSLGY